MRKYYLMLFIFLSLTSQIFSQEIEYQQVESLELKYLYTLHSSSDGDFLITTRTKQNWEATSSVWVNESLNEYSYNEQNLLDTLLDYIWSNGSVWGFDRGFTYIYNQNNKILEIYYYSSSWYNNARNRYIYNGNNLYRIILEFRSGGGWVDEFRTTYQWNSQNFVTMRMGEYRHSLYGFWCYWYKYEYVRDSNNTLLKELDYDGDCCPLWYLSSQKLFSYDGNGNNIEKLSQVWDATDSTWINDFLYLYEYDNSNSLIGTIYQDWDSDSLEWKNVWRESYTYNQQNLLETVLKETWSSEEEWENYTFRTLYYNTDGNWLEDVTQNWDSTSWVNYFRYLATWDEPVSVKNDQLNINSYQLSQNYPNPFNPTTTIKYQIPEISFVTLKVYDVLGNKVAALINEEKPAGSYEVEWNAAGLPSGIYFYQLSATGGAGKYINTKKMLLIK